MILAEAKVEKGKNVKKIALVKRPAIDVDFMKLAKEREDNRKVITDDLADKFITHLKSKGKTLKQLQEEENLVLDEETEMKIYSKPNLGSADDQYKDGKLTKQYRYYYEGPFDEKNRKFCHDVLKLNLWYRHEDIDNMSTRGENHGQAPKPGGGYYPDEGPSTYSIFDYKGGEHCRHSWVKRSFSPGMKFNKEIKLSFDEAKQEIIGPVLIPNKQYYRGKAFFDNVSDGYIFFTKTTVKEIAMNFLNDGNNTFNLDHDNEKMLSKEDIAIMESWLVETENDKAYDLGFSKEQIPLGTWMMKQKVNNLELWEEIKLGNYNGFSIQGNPIIQTILSDVELEEEIRLEKLADDIALLIMEEQLSGVTSGATSGQTETSGTTISGATSGETSGTTGEFADFSQIDAGGIENIKYKDTDKLINKSDLSKERKKNNDRGEKITYGQSQGFGKELAVTTKDGVKIYLIDADYVRDNIDIDYTMGGHGYVYPNYIPEDEVWIDKDMNTEDRYATMTHETTERRAMRDRHMQYDQAHDEANKAELKVRKEIDTKNNIV